MGVGQELTSGLEGVGHVFFLHAKTKKSVKSPEECSFRQLSRVLQGWRRAIFICFPRGSHPMPSTGLAI